MALLESLLLITILIILIYKWSTSRNGELKERGVPHDKPVPFLGNISIDLLRKKTSFLKSTIEYQQKYKSSKIYGFYSMRNPYIFINDAELVKKITIKDFDIFANHKRVFSDEDNEFSRSLISLKDRKWKAMRNTLTPSFTGSKMRLMYELINECCIEAVKYLETEIKSTESQELELEMKDFFTRFTNDVIASAAFGIKVNSFQDRDNAFYNIGSTVMNFSGLAVIKSLLIGLVPKIMKTLKVQVMDAKKINYFNSLVLDAIKYREKNHIVRPDMIQLLMEAKTQSEAAKADETLEQAQLDDKDIVAQCLLFFFAGFETVSSCLCFTLHELMENPDIQEKLYQEIIEVEQNLNGQTLNYDALMKMKYMDMVLSESLRKWPPVIAVERVCSKDYDLMDEAGNLIVKLKKDESIGVPIIALHRDSNNFDNPSKFDPERFSDENKSSIKSGTYLPFGIGPRNCIGNRLALMETKSIIYHILLRFKLTAAPKTSKDLLNSMEGFQSVPKEKFWIKLTSRKNTSNDD